jgi:hypothetical protein
MMNVLHLLATTLIAGSVTPGVPSDAGALDEAETTRAGRIERVQQQMLADYEAGRQHCLELDGKQRDACDARAAGTARAPRGRLGRDVGESDAALPDGEDAPSMR